LIDSLILRLTYNALCINTNNKDALGSIYIKNNVKVMDMAYLSHLYMVHRQAKSNTAPIT